MQLIYNKCEPFGITRKYEFLQIWIANREFAELIENDKNQNPYEQWRRT